jgi:ribose 5-phosphate isomerase B
MNNKKREYQVMRIAIGNDHAAAALKETLKAVLAARDVAVQDESLQEDAGGYPCAAQRVGIAVARGQADLGVLLCGSGVGMSIAANKVKGVRAVCCSEPLSAALSRAHNNANVLCMGARIVGEEMAKSILDAFLAGVFEGDRHAARVALLSKIEDGAEIS